MNPFAITCGDPAGVGPEIVECLLQSDDALLEDAVIIGPSAWCAELTASMGARCEAVGPADYSGTPGRPTEEGARVALEAMELAAAGCLDGRFRGVVSGR